MWRDQALPRLRQRGLGLDRAVETLRLTGIGESALVDLVGKDLLERGNPRMATYARPDFVDLRVSAVSEGDRTASELVTTAVASLSPRLDPYVFGRGRDDWRVALGRRLGDRRLAVLETGTAGYLGLLLGGAPFLVWAEQRARVGEDPVALATEVRQRADAEVGLAAIAREAGDDMTVAIGIALDGRAVSAERSAFRGGETGRRRAANAAAAELWRVLGD